MSSSSPGSAAHTSAHPGALEPIRLTQSQIDQVISAVEVTSSNLDRDFLRRQLEFCAVWEQTARQWKPGVFALAEETLAEIKSTARRLRVLLDCAVASPLDTGWLPSNEWRQQLVDLVQTTKKPLSAYKKRTGEPLSGIALKLLERSPFEVLVGWRLAHIYEFHFGARPPMISRKADQTLDGSFVRFVEKVLEVLGIRGPNGPYARESIVSAWSATKSGRRRRSKVLVQK